MTWRGRGVACGLPAERSWFLSPFRRRGSLESDVLQSNCVALRCGAVFGVKVVRSGGNVY